MAYYKTKFERKFAESTDQELIEYYNREVGIKTWGNARAAYVTALKNEFLSREWNASLAQYILNLDFKTPLLLEQIQRKQSLPQLGN